MKTLPHAWYLWLNALLSEFIEGACDSFLIVAGGSAVTQAGATPPPPLTLHAIATSVLIGGAIYAAAYLKKNPTPFPHDQPQPTPAAAPAIPPPPST